MKITKLLFLFELLARASEIIITFVRAPQGLIIMVAGQEKDKAFQGKTNVRQSVFINLPLNHIAFIFLGFSGIQILVFV